jgi:hypothetical protein
MPRNLQGVELSSLLPKEAQSMLNHSGLDFVEHEGLDSIRDFVLDVFMGRNFRNATEMVTRKRIATLNLGILQFYLNGMGEWDNFVERLPHVAARNIKHGKMSKGERWLNHWVLGLTDKAFQNVLRDDPTAIEDYAHQYVRASESAAEERESLEGELLGQVGLKGKMPNELDWKTMAYIKNTVGASTLTIRGSDKSTFGKLFEKLILGPLLHVLDFKYLRSENLEGQEGVYWLSQTAARESDATLIFKKGEAIRFDIGFIGRGNSEITLDKVTRYRNHIELDKEDYFVRTIIIADRLGDKSTVKEQAEEINGCVFTMDQPLWPREIAQYLDETYGYDHALVDATTGEAEGIIESKLDTAPLGRYLRIAKGKEDAPHLE